MANERIAETDTNTPTLDSPRILIVDPDRAYREQLSRLLRGSLGDRTQIVTAGGIIAALARIEQGMIDVAIIEHQLPDGDGLELLDILARRHGHPEVIVVTAHGDEIIAARAIQLGAADYFRKNLVTADTLAKAIRKACRGMNGSPEDIRPRLPDSQPLAQMDQLVRSLSHDMSANFMVLEHSVGELKRSCGHALAGKLTSGFDHVDACLQESKRFLDDLVTLGKTGVIQMEPSRVELSDVLAEVVYEQQGLLSQRGIDVRVAAKLPIVWCNRSRAKQIFTNLIRNAARHGCAVAEPRITVSCETENNDPANNEFVQVRIHDNGPGIAPAFRDDVFLPGHRAPGAAEDGSGMGLAIVTKIAEYYGGRAWIDPDCEKGITIVVSLPTPSREPAPTPPLGQDRTKSGVRPPHRSKRDASGKHTSRRTPRAW